MLGLKVKAKKYQQILLENQQYGYDFDIRLLRWTRWE